MKSGVLRAGCLVDISTVASRAAIELDNLSLGRPGSFLAFDCMIAWLEKGSAKHLPIKIDGPSNVSFLLGINRILHDSFQGNKLVDPAEVEKETADLVGAMKSFRQNLTPGKISIADAARFRDACLRFARDYKQT